MSKLECTSLLLVGLFLGTPLFLDAHGRNSTLARADANRQATTLSLEAVVLDLLELKGIAPTDWTHATDTEKSRLLWSAALEMADRTQVSADRIALSPAGTPEIRLPDFSDPRLRHMGIDQQTVKIELTYIHSRPPASLAFRHTYRNPADGHPIPAQLTLYRNGEIAQIPVMWQPGTAVHFAPDWEQSWVPLSERLDLNSPSPRLEELAGSPASAPFGIRTLSFQSGVGGYDGTLDLGLISTAPETSDESPFLWVDNNGPEDQRQVVLQFRNLFGSEPDQVPPAASVQSATLRIYLGTRSNSQSYKPVDLHRLLVPWSEGASWSSAAWNGDGIQPDGIEALAEPDALWIFGTPGTYYELDVTAALQAWSQGDPVYGWALLTDWSDGFAFSTSREANVESRPELIVTFDTNPENEAPAFAATPQPADQATQVPDPARIEATVTDADNDPLRVDLYGRPAAVAGPDFKVILLPDTQFYSGEMHGGGRLVFLSQTDWIVENHERLNIPFVLHMGDMVQSGDIKSSDPNGREWSIAAQAMYRLHDPLKTGLTEGIPFAVNVGNHDQEPMWRSSGTTEYFNRYFGSDHFSGFSYYGGHYGENNDNYYSLFSAGEHTFIVISLEYSDPARDPLDTDLLEWADALLKEYSDRIGIIVSHHMVNPGTPATWSPYGEAMYEVLKDNPNLRLMLGGHVTGEGLRVNRHNGQTVYALVQDYQALPEGGSGYLRILNFSPRRNLIELNTYSPWLDRELEDFGGPVTLPFFLGTHIPEFVRIGSIEALPAPGQARLNWPGLMGATEYEWFLQASDGRKSARTPAFTFRTASSTFASWQKGYFEDEDPLGEPEADPDLDGIPNSAEYFFAGNPFAASSSLVTVSLSGSSPELRYSRPSQSGYEWLYETSRDLDTWEPVILPDPGEIVEQDDGTQAVSVQLPADNTSGTRFWRIRPVHPTDSPAP